MNNGIAIPTLLVLSSISAGAVGWALTLFVLKRSPLDRFKVPFLFFPRQLQVPQGFKHFLKLREKMETRKRLQKLREIFPQALGMSIQALKTGQTVPQIVEYLSKECPSPFCDEMKEIRSEMALGAAAEEALDRLFKKYPSFTEYGGFVEAYRISRQTGANLVHLLQVLLEGLEEKNKLLRRMEAMTAQARLSGMMVGALPFLLVAVFFWMDPSLVSPLFTTKTGWCILATALFLESVGFIWIKQILRFEV